jgi:hypothetical protein
MSNKDFNNKKESGALDYLSKNFVSDDGKSLETVKKADFSVFDSTPSNEYLRVPLETLPCGAFYKEGTSISIRAARVQEVQAYSVVDDNNYLDITEKMNGILASCVKYVSPNGMKGSYKDLRDGDRLFLIFMIRELTFSGGKNLTKECECVSCGHEFNMELRATSSDKVKKTFVNHEMPEKMLKFYNEEEKVFILPIDGVEYKLAPPTIGIQELFFGDIKNKIQTDKNPNVSFLKVYSFMLHDRNTISVDGLKSKEQEFKKLSMKTFQILNHAVNQMIFGVKELVSDCPSCGAEVRTDMAFPSGASNIFVVPNAIDEYFG